MAIVAGNWKMNKSLPQALAWLEATGPAPEGVDAALFPPATLLLPLLDGLKRRKLRAGCQDCHWENAGAYTGEISPVQLAEDGVEAVLVGHSERRLHHQETAEMTAWKIRAAREAGLLACLCIGETLEQRRSGRMEEVLLGQLSVALDGEPDARGLWVAYEPVWAIGTGEVATPDQASGAHATIRAFLRSRFPEGGGEIPVLYGGSVHPGNAHGLLTAPDVDGVLVGGASLDPLSFSQILQAAHDAVI